MQKVLFVASTYSHIRNFHLPYLREFHSRGWEVCVACGNIPANPAEQPSFIDKLIDLPFEKKMTSPANFRASSMLRRLFKTERFDLIVTHTSLAAFFARLALYGSSSTPRVINMTHGYLYDDATPAPKRALLRTAERIAARKTDVVLAMNAWDFAEAKRFALGREVAFVPGVGVDFERVDRAAAYAQSAYAGASAASPNAQPRTDKNAANDTATAAHTALAPITELRSVGGAAPFVLFYAAEFSTRKNQSMLIRAMAQLPPRVHLVLAGDGALKTDCERLAASLGVADRITFPGHVTEIGEWLAASDAVVSASRIEGLPFNIMEAMYAGLPVVASDVKGHADLIEHGVTGLLYPYDDERGFAAEVEALLASPERCRELGDAARASVERYSLENVFPQVMAEYDKLAATIEQ